MTSLRTLDLRVLGFGAILALTFVAGCASGVGLDGDDTSSGGGAPATTASGRHASDGGGVPESTAHRIEKFVLTSADNPGLAADVTGVISGKTIALAVPAATDVTGLVPTIAFAGRKIAPESAEPADFSKPVSYVVTADDGARATYVVTVAMGAPACAGTVAGSCSSDVYERAVAFAQANPTRPGNGGTWDGYCGVLAFEFGNFSVAAPSAIDAYHASPIASTDSTTAPIGAFHYWNVPGEPYGHVGVDLLGEGAVVFMASAHVAERLGASAYLGVNSVASYNEAANAQYLGWSLEYNGHGQQLSGGGVCGAATLPAGCTLPKSPTETSGAPDGAFVMRLQTFARASGYTGPIDGNSNAATWKGAQLGLAAYGYTGPADGLPGKNTYKAFQQLAADKGGYTGPIDGELGPNSFKGLAKYLNDNF